MHLFINQVILIAITLGFLNVAPPYLRRAIWQAAFVASHHDPALSLHYQRLRKRGKSHRTAVSAVARKLTHIIFAILRDNKPYEPRPQPNPN